MDMRRRVCAVAAALVMAAAFGQAEKPDALKELRAGNYSRAVEICTQELQENPSNMDSYAVMCWSLIASGRYSECEQRATEARRVNAYDVRLIEVLGEAKYFLNKNNEALIWFERYIANTQENADRLGRVFFYMGQIYINQGRFEHADIALTAAVRYDPTELRWTRLGYARERTGDYRNALVAYNRALALNASQPDALSGRRRCMERL